MMLLKTQEECQQKEENANYKEPLDLDFFLGRGKHLFPRKGAGRRTWELSAASLELDPLGLK